MYDARPQHKLALQGSFLKKKAGQLDHTHTNMYTTAHHTPLPTATAVYIRLTLTL